MYLQSYKSWSGHNRMSPNKQLPKSTIGPIKSTTNKDLSKKVGRIFFSFLGRQYPIASLFLMGRLILGQVF